MNLRVVVVVRVVRRELKVVYLEQGSLFLNRGNTVMEWVVGWLAGGLIGCVTGPRYVCVE